MIENSGKHRDSPENLEHPQEPLEAFRCTKNSEEPTLEIHY